MNLQDRLHDHMRAEMAATAPSNPGAVMDRGDQIKVRRRLLAVGMPVAAAALVTAGVLALRTEPGEAGRGEADGVAAANAALSAEAATFDWQTSPAELGWATQQVADEGVMYALSTAPGTTWEQFPAGNVPEAIYTSADGVNWTAHPTGGTWVDAIAAGGGLLYAVGTAPGAQADSVTLQVGTSHDGGVTFTTATLPFERTGPGNTTSQIMANGDTVLVLTTDNSAGDGTEAPEVTALAYLSQAGADFETVEHPFPGAWIDRIADLGDTTIVSVQGPGATSLMASEDLVEWRPIAQGIPTGWIVDIGKVGEEFVIVGVDAQGSRPLVYRTADIDGVWTEVPVGTLLPEADGEETFAWVNAADVGPNGVAIGLGLQFPASGSNPIMDLIGRVIPGDSAERVVEGDMAVSSVLLTSKDLATWSMATEADLGGMVEAVSFGPQGDLIATVSGQQNGQFQRWTARTPLEP